MHVKRQDETSHGFTIVEVIVALFLLSLAITSLVSIAVTAQYAQRDAYYLSEANRAANSKIEEMKAMPFSEISDGTTDFSSDPSLDNLPSGAAGEVVVSSPALAPDSKQVDVTVTYTIGTLEKEVTMTAYVDPPV